MQLPAYAIKLATSFLQGDVNEKLTSVKNKIETNPRSAPFLTRWGSIVAYLTSSKVPLGKRICALAGLLWVVLPDPVLGPLDDIVLSMALLPWLNKELDYFASGQYDGEPRVDQSVDDTFFVDSQAPLSPSEALSNNPFYIPLEDVERY